MLGSTPATRANGKFPVQDALTRKRDYCGDGVRRSLEASLERRGLDRVDIVWLHGPEDHMDTATVEPPAGLFAALEAGASP